ncbi:unnamed protein product [Schistosoma margrebowiei]|uniref:Uncharacterized protein n=1 Tax=Schistosoma margrebowiei TaxID=48269 RepID=A0A183NC71_9TREM|nr:unnamed protein product [Schistosoma margrebowiei]
METLTSEGKHGIQRTAQSQLDDLNFTDDLALPSHTHQQMQIRKTSVTKASSTVGSNIHKRKVTFLNTTQRIPTQPYLMNKL